MSQLHDMHLPSYEMGYDKGYEQGKLDAAINECAEVHKIPEGFDVKPCPFCNSDREHIIAESYEHGAGKRWRVLCLNCMATMDKGYCRTEWQALDAWNKRNAVADKPEPPKEGD